MSLAYDRELAVIKAGEFVQALINLKVYSELLEEDKALIDETIAKVAEYQVKGVHI